MTPEASFLIACVRQFLGAADDAEVERKRAPVNQDALLALAAKHGVLPLLPSARLKEHVQLNLALTGELLKLLAVFEAARIGVIPVKGPILAWTLYGDVGLRAFSDIDLLVSAKDRERACRVLAKEGYRTMFALHWTNSFRNKEDELPFQDSSGRMNIDVHWSLMPSYCPQPVDVKRLWGRLETVNLAGRAVPVLGDEDLLLFLCVHGAKHLWERLGWICDVGRLIQVRRDLDWELVLRRAREQRCTRFLLLGLAVANEILGVVLPAQFLDAISKDRVVGSRVQIVRSRLFAGYPSPPPGMEQVGFNLPLVETLRGKLRYLHGMVLAPTEAEYTVLKLPPWLHWAYYPFRLFRLGWKQSGQP
jgi:Uncharacterised nucleotidyltransferase